MILSVKVPGAEVAAVVAAVMQTVEYIKPCAWSLNHLYTPCIQYCGIYMVMACDTLTYKSRFVFIQETLYILKRCMLSAK